ncbi:nucleotidyltransferase [Rossellomorea marisflavi]|uniref:nucleotidyltransferase n=1 Tax=Rossellomorea marisflavi TaxID=189381 RepID=UPI0040450510
MNATGIIVEYNPFHNGHLHHLEMTKELTCADVTVAVMSGYFLQRGEPALLGKWERAGMALHAGVDLVIELPYSFATQHSSVFAKGAISLLDSLGCSSFCFGSEDGDIDTFEATANALQTRQADYNAAIKMYSKEGLSYPAALSRAFLSLGLSESFIDLSKPNNILGFHYIQAWNEIDSGMKAHTVTRKSADYHDEHFASPTIASATSIRKALFGDGDREKIRSLMPPESMQALKAYEDTYGSLHQWENYWPLLQYKILSTPIEQLRSIYEIEEGIENRIVECARQSSSFSECMNRLKTKRYTWTRLQRMLLHILMNVSKEEMRARSDRPAYIRLLAMSASGREYLRQHKKEISLPLISKLSSADPVEAALDIRASSIYPMGLKDMNARMVAMKREWSTPPLQLQKS